jgi:orotidine-5'-phosphate decarboxylase
MAEPQQIPAEENAPIFLDPKLQDAAHTIARALKACAPLGARLLVTHAVGAAFMAA